MVHIKPIDDVPFSFYSPTRVEKGKPILTEGWGIEDAPDVSNLGKLQELQREGGSVLPPDQPQIGL